MMIGSNPKKLFGAGSASAPKAPGGLASADRQAVVEDLRRLDRVEPGLGAAAARHVPVGDGHTALLLIEALTGSSQRQARAEIETAPASHGSRSKNKEVERDVEARDRVATGPEGFDPGVMRRSGELFAFRHRACSHHWRFPGTDASPLRLRTLMDRVSTHARASGRDEPRFEPALPPGDARTKMAERASDEILALSEIARGARIDETAGRRDAADFESEGSETSE